MSIQNLYEWNNVKEIDNQKLLDVFTNESISNKIKIWKLLNKSRRKSLKTKWKKQVKQQNIKLFLEHSKNVLGRLSDLRLIGKTIKESEIKNTYELWLVCGIIDEIGILPLTHEKAIDVKQDKKSFETTRNAMIEYLKIFEKRKMGTFSNYTIAKNQFIKELEQLEYVKPPTKKSWELKEREEYLHMMYVAGIGKDRAKSIYTKIQRWSKTAPYERYGICNFEWELQELKNNKKYQDIKRCLETVSHKSIFIEHGFDYPDGYEDIYNEAFSKLLNYGMDEQENTDDILSTMEWEEKKMKDNAFIERNDAGRYFSFIRQEAKKQYPQIFQ